MLSGKPLAGLLVDRRPRREVGGEYRQPPVLTQGLRIKL